MNKKRYLEPVMGGQWAVSREIHGVYIYLIECRAIDDESWISLILSALHITPNAEALDYYFPRNKRRERCPTLQLLELFAHLPPGTGKEIGV